MPRSRSARPLGPVRPAAPIFATQTASGPWRRTMLLAGASCLALAVPQGPAAAQQACSEAGGTVTCSGFGTAAFSSTTSPLTVMADSTTTLVVTQSGTADTLAPVLDFSGAMTDVTFAGSVIGSGDFAPGLFLGGDMSTLVNTGLFSTSGTSSNAVRIEANMVMVTNNAGITSSGDGTDFDPTGPDTNGAAQALFVIGDGFTLDNTDLISAAGADSGGLLVIGDGANIDNLDGTITASGAGSEAIRVVASGGTTIVNNDGTVTTSGSAATGVALSGGTIDFDNTGSISVTGLTADAVVLTPGSGGSVDFLNGQLGGSVGTITSNTGTAVRINTANGQTSMAMNTGTIEGEPIFDADTGTLVSGAIIAGAGNDTVQNGELLTAAGTLGGNLVGGVNLNAGNDSFILGQLGGFTNIIDGGTGTDALTIEAETAARSFNVASFLNFETLTKLGDESLTLTGPGAMTAPASDFDTITVTDGSLILNDLAFTGAAVTLDDGTATGVNDVALTLNANTTIASVAVIGADAAQTLTNAGTITGNVDLGGGDNVADIQAMASVGGSFTTGAGMDDLTLDGTITGNIALGAGDDTVTVGADGSFGGVLDAQGGTMDALAITRTTDDSIVQTNVAGFESLVKNGTAVLSLTNPAMAGNASSFENGITVNDGGLSIDATQYALAAVTLGDATTGDLTLALSNGAEVLSVDVAMGSTGGQAVTLDTMSTIGTTVTLGAGADTLSLDMMSTIGGAVDLGAGADSFTLGNGSSTTGNVDLGTENDSLTLTETFSVTGTIDGNTGTDSFTVNVSTDGTLDATEIDNFETFFKQGAGTLTLQNVESIGTATIQAGGLVIDSAVAANFDLVFDTLADGATFEDDAATVINSITGDDFGQTLTINGTVNMATALAGGNDTLTANGTLTGPVTLGDGDDSFTLAGAATLGATVDGGAAETADALTINANSTDNLGGRTLDQASFLNFETLTKTGDELLTLNNAGMAAAASDLTGITVSAGTLTIEDTAFANAAVTLGSGTSFTLASSNPPMVNLAQVASVTGAGGGETVSVEGTVTGAVALAGGNDSLTLLDFGTVASVGSADGGEGTDLLTVNVVTAATATLDGTLFTTFETLTKTGPQTLVLDQGTSFATLNIDGGTLNLTNTALPMADAAFGGGTTFGLDAASAVNTITGTAAAETVNVSGIINGTTDLGDGGDTFDAEDTSSFATVIGGLGADLFDIDVVTDRALDGSTVTGFETLTKTGAGVFSITAAQDFTQINVDGGELELIDSTLTPALVALADGITLDLQGSTAVDGLTGTAGAQTVFSAGQIGANATASDLAGGDDSVTLTDGFSFGAALSGGAGTDSLTFTLTDMTDDMVDGGLLTGFETGTKTGAGTLVITTNALVFDIANASSFALNEGTVQLGVGTGLTAETITIAQGATLDLLDGTGNTLVGSANDDMITVDGTVTVAMGGALFTGAGADTLINNSPMTISGDVDLGDGGDTLTNSGTLTGDVDFGDGADTLTNSGTITTSGMGAGTLDFGAGVDVFNNAGGTITGTIDLGTGDETLAVTLSADPMTTPDVDPLGTITGTLDGNAGSTGDSLTIASSRTATVNLPGLANFNTFTATATGADTVLTLDQTGANVANAITNGLTLTDSTGSFVIGGGATFNVAAGDAITGSSGDDSLTLNGTVTAGDVDLGAGDDALIVNVDDATLPGGQLLGGTNTDPMMGGGDSLTLNVTTMDITGATLNADEFESLTKGGDATLQLTGGTVTVVDVTVSAGTLDLSAGNTTTVTGLTVTGGTLLLSGGAVTASGDILVQMAGALDVDATTVIGAVGPNDNVLTNLGSIDIAMGQTLDLGDGADTIMNMGSITGAGTLSLGTGDDTVAVFLGANASDPLGSPFQPTLDGGTGGETAGDSFTITAEAVAADMTTLTATLPAITNFETVTLTSTNGTDADTMAALTTTLVLAGPTGMDPAVAQTLTLAGDGNFGLQANVTVGGGTAVDFTGTGMGQSIVVGDALTQPDVTIDGMTGILNSADSDLTVTVAEGASLGTGATLGETAFQGGTGVDTLIVAGTVGDDVDLGDGDDALTFQDSGQSAMGLTLDGGAGTDTLTFDDAVSGRVIDPTEFANFEAFVKNGAASLTVGAGTLDGGASGSLAINAGTVTLNGGTDLQVSSVTLAQGASLTLLTGTAAANFGTAGADTLTNAGNISVAAMEVLDLGDGADMLINTGGTIDGSISLGAGDDTLMVDLGDGSGANILGTINNGTLQGGAGTDTLTVMTTGTAEMSVAVELAGPAEFEQFTATAMGADAQLTLNANITANDATSPVTLNGGGTLIVNQDFVVTGTTALTVEGNGTRVIVNGTAGGGADVSAGAAMSDAVVLNGAADETLSLTVNGGEISGMANAILGGASNDNVVLDGLLEVTGAIDLADGADSLTVGGTVNFATPGVVLDGGAGTDSLTLDTQDGSIALNATAFSFAGFESTDIVGGNTVSVIGTSIGGDSISVTDGDLNLISGSSLTAAQITIGADGSLDIDATSQIGTAGDDMIENAGLIAGTIDFTLVPGGNETVVNSGTINGDIVFGAGMDMLTLDGGTINGDVTFGAGTDTLVSNGGTLDGNLDFGDDDDTLTVNLDGSGGAIGVSMGNTVTGGAGTDTVAITATADDSFALADLTGFEQFDATATGVDTDLTLTGSLASTLNLFGDGAHVVNADITAGTTLQGDANAQRVTVGGTLTGAADLAGGGDSFTLTEAGSVTAVDGGMGTDALVFQAGAAQSVDAGAFTGFETAQKTGAGTTTFSGSFAGLTAFTLSDGSIGGTLDLGAGDQLFIIEDAALAAPLAMGATVDAGAGTADIFQVDNSGMDSLDASGFLNFEVFTKDGDGALTLSNLADVSDINVLAGTLDLVGATVPAVTIDLTGDSVLDVDAASTVGGISGDAGMQTVTLNGTVAGAIDLGAGDDALTVNEGAVPGTGLAGGDGTDSLTFDIATTLGLNADTITGFEQLTKAGAGTVTFSDGTTALTIGDVDVDQGTLALSDVDFQFQTLDLALGTSLTLSDGATLSGLGDDTIVNAGTIDGSVGLGDGTNSVDNSGGTITGGVTGGAGNDTITNTAGGSIGGAIALGDGTNSVDNSGGSITGSLTGGAGSDTVTSEAGGTIGGAIALGGGDDSLALGDLATFTGGTADGGAGTDTLSFAVNTDTAITGSQLANFETVTQNGPATLTVTDTTAFSSYTVSAGGLVLNGGSVAPDASIDLGAGTSLVLEGSLSGGPVDVNGGTGVQTVSIDLAAGDVTLGDGTDSLTLGATGTVSSADAGGGEDALSVAATGDRSLNFATITGFETLSKTGTGTLTAQNASGLDSIDVTAGGLALESAALGAATVTLGADTSLAVGAGSSIGAITGGAGAQSVSVSGVSGAVSTGAGDDSVAVTATATVGLLDGGEGTDTLTFTASSGTPVLTGASFSNFETLVKAGAGGTVLDAISGVDLEIAGGSATTAGAAAASSFGAVSFTGGSALTLDGGASAASVSGSAGGETLTVQNASIAGGVAFGDGDDDLILTQDFTIGGTIDGGAGVDDVDLSVAGGADQTLNGSQFVGFETLDATLSGGTLSFSSNASFANSVTVAGGTLALGTGGFTLTTAAFTASANSALVGTGTITGNATISGTLSPGNSPGTIAIGGNLALADTTSTLIEIEGSSIDLIDVGGSAVLDGDVTIVNLQGGRLPEGSFTFLSADGGVSGAFDTVILPVDPLFEDLSFSQTANGAALVVDDVLNNADLFDTSAALAAAGYVQTVLNTGAASALTLDALADIDALGNANLGLAFNTLSAEPYAIVNDFTMDQGLAYVNLFSDRLDRIADRMEAGDDDVEPGDFALWVSGLTSFADQEGGAQNDWDSSQFGIAMGAELALFEQLRIGVTGGYTTGEQTLSGPGLTVNSDLDGYFVGGYVIGQYGPFRAGVTGTQAFSDVATSRGLITADGNPTAFGDYDTDMLTVHGEFAARLLETDLVRIEPVISGTYLRADRDAVEETGAPGLNLEVDGQTTEAIFVRGGARVSGRFELGEGVLIPELGAAFRYDIEDESRLAVARLLGNGPASFTSFAARPDREVGEVEAGVTYQMTNGFSLFVHYDGVIGDSTQIHRASAGLQFDF